MLAKILNVLRNLAWGFVGLSVLLNLIVVIPWLFGYQSYAIGSGSMEPSIKTGALVYVNAKDHSPDIDDVITFRLNNGQVVTHRVVSISDGVYTTKGDANQTADPAQVSESQIIGTLAFQIPLVGYLFLTLGPWRSWLAICLVTALILFWKRR